MSFDLSVDDPAWAAVSDLDAVCAGALQAGWAAAQSAGGEVALLLTSDAAMQTLNAQFRGKDAPTDVLAFPAEPGTPASAGEGRFLGDIALGFGICARDAADLGRPLPAHLAHLVVHGYLHLLGYDHMDDTNAAEMQALEATALARLGLPDPYAAVN